MNTRRPLEWTGPTSDSAPINILIVDDEPANLIVLETVLDDPAYRLVRAQSADQALMALVRDEFALLILDIRMPEMTGFELAQMIKERKKTAAVPIIFLTAYYDKDQHVLEGYGTGAVDFLNKPVNPAVLRSKVAVFADLHRKSRAVALTNRALLEEVQERRRAEDELRLLNATLEQRVVERTEALRRADLQLREMMGSISDGLLMLDRAWRFTYLNEQGAHLLGGSVDALLGACIWELAPQRLSARARRSCHEALDTRRTVSFEEHFEEPQDRWYLCHCYPSDAGLSVYFLDITERREVESRREALLAAERAARSEGERAARAKEEFLASLSHELRTPLTAILGWTTAMQRETAAPPAVRRGVDVIARNARALSQLVADLLDVSRIAAGKLRVSLEPVDLNSIALAGADTSRPDAQAKGVSIEMQLSSEPPWIIGDADRLHQVASNLITNAIKFTPAGGVVTVATSASTTHGQLRISDTGEGISEEFLPHLFERFSQADGSAARVHGGLGLGLSIVKSLVELHAGSVGADSAGVGHGSSFRVDLPRVAEPDAAKEEAHGPVARSADAGSRRSLDAQRSALGASALQGIQVLLVDDHEDVLEVQRRLLCDCGAVVTPAHSGLQALELLRHGRFDVLLSDLGMPGMDGYALVRQVRRELGISAAQMPALAVTAYVRAEDRQLALQDGYQGVVQKPVDVHELSRLMRELLGERRPLDAAGVAELDPGPARPSEPASPAGRRLRALFVEDNMDLQEQIGWLLEDEGLDLVKCSNGEQAVAELDGDRFDLVITDVSLPNMSGVDLAKVVLARSPQAWVVFSTGYGMGHRLSDFGPNVRALLKPFEIDTLRELLAEVRATGDAGALAVGAGR